MYNATEQFAELNKANVAQARKIAAVTLGNAEKLIKLNLSAAKSCSRRASRTPRPLPSVKDVQELFTLRARLAETGVQTALAYSRRFYELASEAQAQFTALSEETWANYSKGVANWVERRRSRRRPARKSPSTRSSRRSLRPPPRSTSSRGDQAGREPRRCEHPCRGGIGCQGCAGQGRRKAA